MNADEIKQHYMQPEIKEAIIRVSEGNGAIRAGNHDFKGWYLFDSEKGRRLARIDKDYDKLVSMVDRSLYYTLDVFDEKLFDQWDIEGNQTLGLPEDIRNYTLAVDIDLADGYSPEELMPRTILQEAVKFTYNKINDLMQGNVFAAFSGGGVYVLIHHKCFEINPEGLKGSVEDAWLTLMEKFNMLIEDIEEEFFKLNPDFKQYIHFDTINNKKRLIKTIGSIHKTHDYAVIPLKMPDFAINLEDAKIPLKKDVLTYIKQWYNYTENKSGRHNFLRKLQEYEETAEAIVSMKKNRMTLEKIVSDVKIDIGNEYTCPVMTAIMADKDWGDAQHRRIAVITSYLAHLGWSEDEIIDYISSKSWSHIKGLHAFIRNSLELVIPKYDTLYSSGTYPMIGFKGLERYLPDKPKFEDPVRYTLKTMENKAKYEGIKVDNSIVEVILKLEEQNRRYTYEVREVEADMSVLELKGQGTLPMQWGEQSGFIRRLKESYVGYKKSKSDTRSETAIKDEASLEIRELLKKLEDKRVKIEKAIQFKKKYTQFLFDFKTKAYAKESQEHLEQEENILAYIGSVSDYIGAGERTNILFGLCCHLSTILLEKSPINFYPVGKAGEGKSIVADASLMLLPKQYVIEEQPDSVAAVSRRAQNDTYFYDKKVIYMGDLGGTRDAERTESVRNIFKALNSDGKFNRPVSDKNSNFDTIDLNLLGYPSLLYTTARQGLIEGQELSRGFEITPRMDNKDMVTAYLEIMSQKGKSKKYKEIIKDRDVEKIRNMILYVKDRNLEVINPYTDVLKDWINKSKYIKRDYSKLMNIAEVITLMNESHRPHYVEDGREFVITQPNDIVFFIEILSTYINSILTTIPPYLIKLHEFGFEKYGEVEVDKRTITRDMAASTNPHLNRIQSTSVGKYLDRLDNIGLVEKSRDGNKNYYKFEEPEKAIDLSLKTIQLSEYMKNVIINEHSQDLLNFVEEHLNPDIKPLSIHQWNIEDIPVPTWEKMETDKRIRAIKVDNDVNCISAMLKGHRILTEEERKDMEAKKEVEYIKQKYG